MEPITLETQIHQYSIRANHVIDTNRCQMMIKIGTTFTPEEAGKEAERVIKALDERLDYLRMVFNDVAEFYHHQLSKNEGTDGDIISELLNQVAAWKKMGYKR